MKNIAYYRENGEIVVVSTLEDDMEPPALEWASWAEVPMDILPSTHRVVDGWLEPYTPEGVQRKASQPGPDFAWDPATEQWVDNRTLEQHRDDQWEIVKAARDAFEFSVFEWDGSEFDANATSQQRIQGAALEAVIAQLTSAPYSQEWTLADNSIRTLSSTDMVAVGKALSQHVTTAHERGRIKRQELNDATTVTQIQAVTW